MELERLILYTVLQAKGKLNENVNEDAMFMFGAFSSQLVTLTLKHILFFLFF